MPRARYTADGGRYRIAGTTFEPDDEHEVNSGLADYLADHEDFEIIEETSDSTDESGGDEQTDESETDESADAEDGPEDSGSDGDDSAAAEGDGFDVDAFLDRTPVDDVAADILEGAADGHLDALAEEAERVGVSDAIGERRAELAEE